MITTVYPIQDRSHPMFVNIRISEIHSERNLMLCEANAVLSVVTETPADVDELEEYLKDSDGILLHNHVVTTGVSVNFIGYGSTEEMMVGKLTLSA